MFCLRLPPTHDVLDLPTLRLRRLAYLVLSRRPAHRRHRPDPPPRHYALAHRQAQVSHRPTLRSPGLQLLLRLIPVPQTTQPASHFPLLFLVALHLSVPLHPVRTSDFFCLSAATDRI